MSRPTSPRLGDDDAAGGSRRLPDDVSRSPNHVSLARVAVWKTIKRLRRQRSILLHVPQRFWIYIGPDLFTGARLAIFAGSGFRHDAAPDEIV